LLPIHPTKLQPLFNAGSKSQTNPDRRKFSLSRPHNHAGL
jgi:hypothetical protein